MYGLLIYSLESILRGSIKLNPAFPYMNCITGIQIGDTENFWFHKFSSQ